MSQVIYHFLLPLVSAQHHHAYSRLYMALPYPKIPSAQHHRLRYQEHIRCHDRTSVSDSPHCWYKASTNDASNQSPHPHPTVQTNSTRTPNPPPRHSNNSGQASASYFRSTPKKQNPNPQTTAIPHSAVHCAARMIYLETLYPGLQLSSLCGRMVMLRMG